MWHSGDWRDYPKRFQLIGSPRLLKTFDRSSATGKRDYAITRCFIDLGLRTIEVARLRLDDFDWRQRVVRISGKGHRGEVLPLPHATGHAIADYLRYGRPKTGSRALFMRHSPPINTPASVCVVHAAVRYAARRCGLEPCFHGPHVLRHTLAQRLVQRGVLLKQIADLLRHRSLDSTTIYNEGRSPRTQPCGHGAIIYSIYAPGVDHYDHSFWRMNWGQNYLSQLTDETGGESYYLGFGAPVSLVPYLDDLSHRLNRQYRLTFLAKA